MTDTKLKEALAALPVYEAAKERQEEKIRKSQRIGRKIQKNEARAHLIINCHKIKPGMGYLSDTSWHHYGHPVCRPFLHSGTHIQFPRESTWSALLKKETNRTMRRCREDVPRKGNFYRRLVERWYYTDY